jgi:hypothetical protein
MRDRLHEIPVGRRPGSLHRRLRPALSSCAVFVRLACLRAAVANRLLPLCPVFFFPTRQQLYAPAGTDLKDPELRAGKEADIEMGEIGCRAGSTEALDSFFQQASRARRSREREPGRGAVDPG